MGTGMVFEVRRATYDDIPEIKSIINETFNKYMELAGLTEKVDALKESTNDIKKDIDTKRVYVAYVDDLIVGTVRLEIFEDHSAYISRFGVKPDFQNNGVGKAIMNVVDMVMKKNNVKKAYLHAASKILPLIRFYYGRGFYIKEVSNDRGYLRALLCKEYK
jgi:N-acetylglutamate synthase-like GNAT family acetyltransferase